MQCNIWLFNEIIKHINHYLSLEEMLLKFTFWDKLRHSVKKIPMMERLYDFFHIKEFMVKTKDKYQWVFYGAHPTGFENYINDGTFEVNPERIAEKMIQMEKDFG